MLLSAVSVLVVAQSSSEIQEGLTNNPVYVIRRQRVNTSTFWNKMLHCTVYTPCMYITLGNHVPPDQHIHSVCSVISLYFSVLCPTFPSYLTLCTSSTTRRCLFNDAVDCNVLCSFCNRRIIMEYLRSDARKCCVKITSQRQFVNHKSLMDWPGIETRSA